MIVAPTEFLAAAIRVARLDPNAIQADGAEAELVYPSFFCTTPHPWMKVLAWLSMRNIEFRIYLIEVEPNVERITRDGMDLGTGERERFRLGIYPRADADLLALMREIDDREVEWLLNMTDRVEWALDHMRAHAQSEDLLTETGVAMDSEAEVE